MPLPAPPSMLADVPAADPNFLLDALLQHFGLKNDAALSRALQLSASSVSKLRSRRQELSPVVVLRIHETFDVGFRELRSILRGEIPAGWQPLAPARR